MIQLFDGFLMDHPWVLNFSNENEAFQFAGKYQSDHHKESKFFHLVTLVFK